uniref:Uncharacterized protein n=1 Tax=Lactuca sativa TaxID=4236 RepID=A0A9R1VW07_LACSA|nr:hypothetical protein LSAT_V11C400198910 [Lactuca sativa]
MFVVFANDGNNLTFPIAFGMAVENNVFLMSLKECIGEGREIAFISNMYDGISSCVDNVFSDSYRGYTCNSVQNYLRTRVGSGRSLETLFLITLKSYTLSSFAQNFSRLSIDAREVLTNIGHPKWARAYFPNIRSNVLNMEVPQYFSVVSRDLGKIVRTTSSADISLNYRFKISSSKSSTSNVVSMRYGKTLERNVLSPYP